jgi:predicted peptidase
VRLRAKLIAVLLLVPVRLFAQDVETGFLDRTVSVNGALHRYQLYIPADYRASPRPWPVILFLHGAGERGADGLLQTSVGLGSAIRSAGTVSSNCDHASGTG